MFSCFSRKLFAFGFSVLLASCGGSGGGGGDSSAPPAPHLTLSGVVISDPPLAGITVLVWSAGAGATSCQAVTDDQGRYSTTCYSMEPPFRIVAQRISIDAQNSPQNGGFLAYPLLESIVLEQGTVTANITPLSTLLVAKLRGTPTSNRGGGFGPEFDSLSTADLQSAQQAVVDYLKDRPAQWDPNIVDPVDVSMISDFLTAPISASAGDPYFDAVTRLAASLIPGENISAIEEHMLNRSLPPADVNSLMTYTDVGVNCDSAPVFTYEPVPGLPAGDTTLSIDSAGVLHIGSYSMNYGPLSLGVSSGPSIFEKIELGPADVGNGEPGFKITFEDGVFSDAWLYTQRDYSTMLLESSTCYPTAPAAIKMQPTRFELVKLAASAMSQYANNTVDCGSAPSFPGIQPGNNLVSIDDRGALVVNGGIANNGITQSLLSGSVYFDENNTTPSVSPPFYVTRLTTSDDFNSTAISIKQSADGKITSLQMQDQQNSVECSN